jgi:hypothetical protein
LKREAPIERFSFVLLLHPFSMKMPNADEQIERLFHTQSNHRLAQRPTNNTTDTLQS